RFPLLSHCAREGGRRPWPGQARSTASAGLGRALLAAACIAQRRETDSETNTMQTIRYELIDAAGGKVAQITFDEANSPVNTMCRQWQDDLAEVTAKVLADRAQLKGIVLASAKSSFFAGADLKATMRLTPGDAPAVFGEIERMKKQFRT